MPKRSSKPDDLNRMALAIVKEATEEPPRAPKRKNPAAVMLGHLGGMKGGKARAAALSPEDRKRIATDAAKARWGESPKKS
jgi:hypothetical protein